MWVAESSDLLPIVELSHTFWLVWLMHGVVTLPLALQVVAFGPDVSGFVRVKQVFLNFYKLLNT